MAISGGVSGFDWCHVLGGVYWTPWPKVRSGAGRPSKVAMLATAPGEDQRPEDKPREGSRPAEQGGHHQGPEQCPGPPDHWGEGRGTQLPALQQRSAHMVRPVWGLHLGPVQAESALHQWVTLVHSDLRTHTREGFSSSCSSIFIKSWGSLLPLDSVLSETSFIQTNVSEAAVVFVQQRQVREKGLLTVIWMWNCNSDITCCKNPSYRVWWRKSNLWMYVRTELPSLSMDVRYGVFLDVCAKWFDLCASQTADSHATTAAAPWSAWTASGTEAPWPTTRASWSTPWRRTRMWWVTCGAGLETRLMSVCYLCCKH